MATYDSRAVILYDSNGLPLAVQDGVAIPANTQGILSYGTDAGTARIILVDASGRQVIVGAAPDGAAPVGDPVLIAGQDGVDVHSILTDATGQLLVAQPVAAVLNAQVQGPDADGAAPLGNPVLMAGSDGVAVQTVRTDAAGRLEVSGAALDGTAPIGNPVLIAGQDGVNVQSLLTDATGKPLVDVRGWFGSVAPTVGQKTSANSVPVVLASDQSTINVTQLSTTGTVTTTPANLAPVVALAANAARKGATVFVDGGAANDVFLKCGPGVSTVSFTTKLSDRDYFEIPFGYTGVITVVWSPVAAGNLRVTEFT